MLKYTRQFAGTMLALVFLSFQFTTAAEPCVKTSFKGDASTYNPFLPGWRTGGGTLATGGWYNPNEYEAALQLAIAKQYRCGYGRGAICDAIVQAPNGRSMVVRINDNGPLVSGRVIDLNEKSMQYLSGGSMGRNSGVIKDVTVTLLCGIEGQSLGPLDPRDREAWASRTFDAPYANLPIYNQATPAGLLSGQNCIVSTEPLVVVPCSSIVRAQPATPVAPVSPAPVSAAPASSAPVNQPLSQSIGASGLLAPLQSVSAETGKQAPSKTVSDLLNALSAPTSSLVKTPAIKVPPDLRESARESGSLFQQILKQMEAITLKLVDLVRRL
ncbi:MAG: Lipoprotein [Candidatus Kaiserbacteria bacterium GW2011_GWA2_58_9]|uniref:Lipoprotein n=1 Tax=Candidatus Kaiserbacteria bacterium GW2011_GWA2_58_9 TaxID=1618672 RepID=A0A0G2B1M9_9BACT|nr:MAG: Lipoprotein [Candidatus Kaiserbacteria bacterium GW2011_GWA2_58_9]